MSDLIDRQAAIDDIWTVSPLAHLDREWIDRWLRQLPPANNSEIPNSSDTISRAKAIEALKSRQDGGKGDISRFYNTIIQNDIEAIEQLPPAQPNTGKWALQSDDYHEYYECDQCGMAVGLDDVRNFCPNCGAMMEVTT